MQGGEDCCTSGDAIIDEDDHPALQLGMAPVTEIAHATAPDLRQLLVTHDAEFFLGDASATNDVLVPHGERMAAIDHRAHREFGLKGNADLTSDYEIERR